MTAPTTDAAPGGVTEGQAPTDTGQVDPGRTSTDSSSSGGDAGSKEDGGPRGRRAPTERVRTASRDDDAPQDTDGAGDGDAGKGGKGEGGKEWRIEDLPPGAQKLIKDLRTENGSRRNEAAEAKKAKEAAEQAAKAGDERFANATEAFMRALGLTPEPDEPERSPEELVGELTTKYQQISVELAVYRAAKNHDGDPDALLDSRGFITKAHALDPAADNFAEAIAQLISDAVDSNPKLRAAPAEPGQAAPSGGDFGGGPAGPVGPEDWSVDDFRRERNNKGRGSY